MSSSHLSDPDGSVSDSPIRSRCKLRSDKSVEDEDEDEEVFSMTTQTEKDSLVSEFRHRKGKRVLPFSTSSTGETSTWVCVGGRSSVNDVLLSTQSNLGRS